MRKAEYASSQRPAFIDQMAVELVVVERLRVKLTPSERRHAAHGLVARGLSFTQTAEVLGVTKRTVERLVKYPPPPILDVDESGERVLVG